MSRLKMFWVCVALLSTATAAGQGRDSLRVTLFFRVGEMTVDGSYMGNDARLVEFARGMSRLPRVIYAEIGATASPEGSAAINRSLADRRADAVERLLRGLAPDLGVPVARGAGFEYDWRGLREAVERDPAVPERPRLLEIIDDRSMGEAERNLAVRRLGGGRTFDYVKLKILRAMRTGSILIVVEGEPAPPPVQKTDVPTDTTTYAVKVPARPDSAATHVTLPAIEKRRLRFALKTNLLFDIVGAANVGVEFPTGRHLSITADAAYSYWRIGNLFALQTIQGGASAKWWFDQRRGRLTGWNAGVYGMLCTRYDAQWRDGVQGDGFWSAGVVGGYAFPVSKRLRMEVAAAAGYLFTPEMRTYTRPDEGHLMWHKTSRNVGRVSLTRLQLNLVWLLGREGAR